MYVYLKGFSLLQWLWVFSGETIETFHMKEFRIWRMLFVLSSILTSEYSNFIEYSYLDISLLEYNIPKNCESSNIICSFCY